MFGAPFKYLIYLTNTDDFRTWGDWLGYVATYKKGKATPYLFGNMVLSNYGGRSRPTQDCVRRVSNMIDEGGYMLGSPDFGVRALFEQRPMGDRAREFRRIL